MLRCTKENLWKSLEDHAHSIRLHLPKNLTSPASNDRQIFTAFSSNIHLDYSNQHVTTNTMELLISLADSCGLREKINALIKGDIVNHSENRPALHTALRAPSNTSIFVNAQDIMPEIIAAREKIKEVVEKIRTQRWLGYSGKPITDIVNIGIGGSDLGPRFCLKALKEFTTKDLGYHFISDADPNSFKNAVEKLTPDTTLFIVSSKSFTTQETLYNAKKAMAWIGESNHYEQHFIAVTAHVEKAKSFGITTVLPIWEWIGGRYSFCSAINLISAIAIGFEHFTQLLAGANSMDTHFQQSNLSNNLPVLLALIGIWNNNFLHIHNLLFLTYTQNLEHFVPYIQQLDMESNGKSIDIHGKTVNHATGPIIWGGLGNQAQHSYYQLLCQGTHKVTADFISLNEHTGQMINTMCEAKFDVLATGVHNQENPNGYIPGNIPLNHIRISDVKPFSIGALVALYEHKVFTQSVIWGINPFDQPGVESAKQNYYEKTTYTNAIEEA